MKKLFACSTLAVLLFIPSQAALALEACAKSTEHGGQTVVRAKGEVGFWDVFLVEIQLN